MERKSEVEYDERTLDTVGEHDEEQFYALEVTKVETNGAQSLASDYLWRRGSDDYKTDHVFTLAGFVFECWVVAGGHQYEWRSQCGRFIARREEGSSRHLSYVDGRQVIGDRHQSMRDALAGALSAVGIDVPQPRDEKLWMKNVKFRDAMAKALKGAWRDMHKAGADRRREQRSKAA